MKKFLEIIKNKWLIKGTTTIALIAIVIACYILLNWGVEKIKIQDIDLTANKLYSLSEETITKIKNLDQEITIQLLNMNENYGYAIEYANKYAKASNKIKVEEVPELSSRLDLTSKYSIQASESIIVVKMGDKEKVVKSDELYTYDYFTNEQIDRTEEALTNAIVEIMTDKKPKIYILEGKTYYNTEEALYTLIEELKEDANEVEYLDLLKDGKIPEDCSCLMITTLSKDISELEKDEIIKYIKKGGKLIILSSQSTMLDVETPNFNTVLQEYGITLEKGIIFEQDTSRMLRSAPYWILTDANASFMADINMNLKMCFVETGKISFEESSKLSELGVTYESIAISGTDAFLRKNFNIMSYEKTDEDEYGASSTIAAVVTKTIDDKTKSELVIYASELCASNLQITVNEYQISAIDLHNNKDVILNSISHLTERTDTITIRKANEETQRYTVTEKEDSIIKTIIFTLPVVVIVAGIVIWIIRIRKR